MDSPTALDLLISKALDGAAAPEEWDALERTARADGGAAAELVLGLRVHRGLERALEPEVATAGRVALPGASIGRGRSLRAAPGWLAAGLLACAWLVSEARERAPGGQGETGLARAPVDAPVEIAAAEPPRAPVAPPPTAAEDARAGESVGELPLLMVDSRPLEDGGYEVLYMRRTLERARVDELLELDPAALSANAAPEVF